MSPAPNKLDAIVKLSQPFTDVLAEIVRDSGDEPKFMTGCFPLDVKLSMFPNGGCRFSSILFGLLLRNHKIVTTLVEGWQCLKCDDCKNEDCKDRREHVWLEYDGWIIDLTCCQFDGFPQQPFIKRGSDWHTSSWRIRDRKGLTSFEIGDRGGLIAEIEHRLTEPRTAQPG